MLFRYELRRFRGLLPVLALVFVTLVPLIYGAVYLSANWDPHGRLSSLPVAIVNQDQPVEYDGKTLSTGADITADLVEQNSFDWTETTREDAEAGLSEGRYYLVMEIPEDLSADLVSADDGTDPEQAHITLRRDDANGFVIGSLTAASQTKIENSVNTAAVEAYFKAVFQNLGTIREGMADAADGASRLADGAAQADEGAQQLTDGLTDAHAGAGQLADGATDAQDGASRLADGAQQLNDGAASLDGGVADAQEGAGQLSAGLADAREGSQQLADGAEQLGAAAPGLTDGATSLSDGLTTLDTSSGDLADGAHQLADGTQQLSDTLVPGLQASADGQQALAEEVAALDAEVKALDEAIAADAGAAGSLGEASAQVAAHAAAVDGQMQAAAAQDAPGSAADAITRLDASADALAEGADALHTGVGQAQDGAQDLADGVGRFSGGLTGLSTGAADLDDGLAQLQDGSGQLEDGLGQLKTGTGDLAEGADALATGATDLETGVGQLATGATDLDSGLAELETGSGDLQDGAASLASGAADLRDGLQDGTQRIPALSANAQDDAALVMSHPVDVGMEVLNPAGVYGRGMAPLFFSIALWVFGIAAFNIMRPVSGRLLAGRRHPLLLAVAAWLPVGVVAVVGSLLMLGATCLLGMNPAHPWHAVGLTVFTAIVFSIFAHLVQTALGTPGSAILLVTLILQLASTGGTYPSELLPGFFRWIGPAMPMTHSIDAFRYAISGGLPSQFWGGAAFLAVFGVVALLLDMACVRGRQRFRMKDLHPALEK